jgi:2-alkyl-3-oxoalkanoate reductase
VKVFVTGGTGLVGSHVAAQLAAAGDEVVALARPTADTSFLRGTGARVVIGDLLDAPERLAEPMRGCDAVVHAGAALYGADPRAFEAINVGGTERVLVAAALAGASRAVHVSSIAVYGGAAADGRPLTEERWRDRDVGRQKWYPYTKRRSEELAWSLHEQGLVRLTTVRPGVIYGERDRLATPWLIRAARLRVLPVPRGGRTLLPLVYAGNVAAAVLAALAQPRSIGRAYNLSDGEPVTARRALQTLARELGRRLWIVPVPATPLMAAARVGDLALRLLPGREVVSLTRGLTRFTVDNPYDSSRARRELGWTGLVTHEEALARTVRWWADTRGDATG